MDSDMIKGLNKAIDAATGKTGTEYTYLNNTPVTEKLDELAEAIAAGGGGGGGQVNVQSDWNETDTTSDAYIKNKPTIPAALSDLTDDATHRTVTDAEKAAWNAGGSSFVYINDTLYAGETTLIINDPNIKTTSIIEVFTDVDVNYKEISVLNGGVTIVYDALDYDMDVIVRISEANIVIDPESGLSFSKLFETFEPATYTVSKPGLYFVSSISFRPNRNRTITINSDNQPLNSNSDNITTYYFAILNKGDTITFNVGTSGSDYSMIGDVIFIKDAEFVNVVKYDIGERRDPYTTPDDNKLYFVYGACYYCEYDHSTTGEKATKYISSNGSTHVLMASCVGNDVTVNLYGYNFGYGSESILVAEMSRG